MNDPKYPHIRVRLIGCNGNAFQIMGRITAEMKRHGLPKSEIDAYSAEAMSGDYDNLLRVCMRWVSIE